jgi:hypothetical protein
MQCSYTLTIFINDTGSLMHIALRTYTIFYLNKLQVENSLDAYACWLQPTGCQTKPTPLMLKATV